MEYKSLIEIIKVLGKELDEMQGKIEEARSKNASESLLKEKQASVDKFRGLVEWNLKILDRHHKIEAFLGDLRGHLLVDGILPQHMEEMPLGTLYGLIEEDFKEVLEIIDTESEEERKEGIKFVEEFKKKQK